MRQGSSPLSIWQNLQSFIYLLLSLTFSQPAIWPGATTAAEGSAICAGSDSDCTNRASYLKFNFVLS